MYVLKIFGKKCGTKIANVSAQQQALGVHLGGTCCAVFCTAVWLSPSPPATPP